MKIRLCILILCVFIFQLKCLAQKKTHWKIYDQDFHLVTSLNAQELSIKDDLIWYRSKGKYGVMDVRRNILIKPKYDYIAHHTNRFTVVGTQNCFGVVYSGKEILPLEYSNRFRFDTTGYFIAYSGCSEKIGAYIIGTYSIHDKMGRVISQGCESDIKKLFMGLTNQSKPIYNTKKISNGFTIKVIPPTDDHYIKGFEKGIYNRKDSLIFSCSKCFISDNVNGRFLIDQRSPVTSLSQEISLIDTSGNTLIQGGYNRLSYDQKHDLFLFKRKNELGIIDGNGKVHTIVKTIERANMRIISKNRFIVSFPDSVNSMWSTIYDSLGAQVFGPVKNSLEVIGENCLIYKNKDGYVFTDGNGKSISPVYDSTFALSKFHYETMVLGIKYSGNHRGNDTRAISHLEYDGFSWVLPNPSVDFYGVAMSGKKGIFNVLNSTATGPQYSLVARLEGGVVVAMKDKYWFLIGKNETVKSVGKNKHIKSFEKYIAVGN